MSQYRRIVRCVICICVCVVCACPSFCVWVCIVSFIHPRIIPWGADQTYCPATQSSFTAETLGRAPEQCGRGVKRGVMWCESFTPLNISRTEGGMNEIFYGAFLGAVPQGEVNCSFHTYPSRLPRFRCRGHQSVALRAWRGWRGWVAG